MFKNYLIVYTIIIDHSNIKLLQFYVTLKIPDEN